MGLVRCVSCVGELHKPDQIMTANAQWDPYHSWWRSWSSFNKKHQFLSFKVSPETVCRKTIPPFFSCVHFEQKNRKILTFIVLLCLKLIFKRGGSAGKH